MNTIKYSDLEFNSLEELSVLAGRSKIYTEKNIRKNAYKIYNETKKELLEHKKKKLEIFSEITSIDSLVRPHTIIDNNGNISTIINTIPLSIFLEEVDINKYIFVLLNVSKDMQKIHNLDGRPVIGDMNFNNIGIDKYNKHHFFDLDSYGIYKMKPDDIPKVLASYCDYMNYSIENNQDEDRLSFILSLFSSIFGKNVYAISIKEYDEYIEKYPLLQQLKDIFLDLKMSYSEIPDMPYLHELIRK